jgi:hypothetical protein
MEQLTVTSPGAYSFNWSNAISTEDLANLLPGMYSVTVSDINGCSSADTFTIDNQIVLPSIAQSIIPSTCGNTNGQIDVTVSPPGAYLFEWSNGATSEDQINVSAGTYSLTVTAINGCSVASMTVTNTIQTSPSRLQIPQIILFAIEWCYQLTITPPGIYNVLMV